MDWLVVLPALTALLALLFAWPCSTSGASGAAASSSSGPSGCCSSASAPGPRRSPRAAAGTSRCTATWYLTGAVWTAGWLGLGTAFLLGRTRFGYSFALCLFLAGLFTFLVRHRPEYAGAGALPLLYFMTAGVLALAVAVETYFPNERWPRLAAAAVVGATLLSHRAHGDHGRCRRPGYALDPATGIPVGDAVPGAAPPADAVHEHHRRVRAHPRRRVLDLRVHAQAPRPGLLARPEPARRRVPVQPAHRPGRHPREPRGVAAGRGPGARWTGTIHSRVPATILIAIGAFIPTLTDSLNRFGATELFQLGKFLGVVFLFAGFLVSIEVFREIRIPFTSIRCWPDGTSRPRPTRSRPTVAAAARSRARRDRPPRSTDRRLRTIRRWPRRPAAPVRVRRRPARRRRCSGPSGRSPRFVYETGMEPIPFVALAGPARRR